MKATAVVFEGVREVAFREIDVPEPGPGDSVIRTKYSLISNGTEGSFLRGERVGGEDPPKPGDTLPFPQVTGYQKVGIVERAGEGSGLEVGQWAFSTVTRVGFDEQPMGGHVSVAVGSDVYGLPEGLDPVEASGLVLTQVGVNCGDRPGIQEGAAAVVIGDGMVGQWAAQTLQHRGARVALVGKHRYRYERLRLREGDRVIDLGEAGDLADAVRAAYPEGVDVLVDSVGVNDVVVSLDEQLRHNSHLVSAGYHGERGNIDIQMLRRHETTLHCPSGWARDRMLRTIELLESGALYVSPLITHRMKAEEAPEAFRMILEKQDGLLGVLLEWE